jgi:2'-5' RNA ligase
VIAVVSLLDEDHSRKVKSLIDQIEEHFGLSGVQMTPYPHITWLLAEIEGELGKLKEFLKQTASNAKPFEIQTTGLGIFTGEHPVLHIPVVRNQVTNAFHMQLYREVIKFSSDIPKYYNPTCWVPHFSLALADTNPEVVAEILQWLNEQNFNWNIRIDNLAIMTQYDNQFLKEDVFYFKKQMVPAVS